MNCPECTKPFHQPKQLPCGHTLCRRCIVALLEGNTKNCPICKDCLDPDKDVDLYTPNILITDLLAINSKYEPCSLNEPSIVVCEFCNERKSVDFCVDCVKYMCQACRIVHTKVPVLQSHVIYEVTCENSPIIELRKMIPLCTKHSHEVASFCTDCKIGVCTKCRETCPSTHVFEDLHTHCIERRKEIVKFVEDSNGLLQNYSEVLDAYDDRKQKMAQDKDRALEELESIFSAARSRLEKNEVDLKSKVKDKYESKCLEMNNERKRLREEKLKLSSRTEYLRFLSEYGSDAHIVTECNEINEMSVYTEEMPSIENLKKFEVIFQRNLASDDTIVNLNFGELENYYILDDYEQYDSKPADEEIDLGRNGDSSKENEHLSRGSNESGASSDANENLYDDYSFEEKEMHQNLGDQSKKTFLPLPPFPSHRLPIPPPTIPHDDKRKDNGHFSGGSNKSEPSNDAEEELYNDYSYEEFPVPPQPVPPPNRRRLIPPHIPPINESEEEYLAPPPHGRRQLPLPFIHKLPPPIPKHPQGGLCLNLNLEKKVYVNESETITEDSLQICMSDKSRPLPSLPPVPPRISTKGKEILVRQIHANAEPEDIYAWDTVICKEETSQAYQNQERRPPPPPIPACFPPRNILPERGQIPSNKTRTEGERRETVTFLHDFNCVVSGKYLLLSTFLSLFV
ncbi:hypothetical protein FSP39_011127 [Pinctada imbricata]|uniref:Uncharacterized protein n=1 Tax=Pinctada imbricata TaxID=66713 RepID=A0AA88Y3W1_PINIB|nr:hypothetical protein FSP39_011127 [Pinctada imbricata]